MATLIPSFYPAFRCDPSACHHSCCIEWEIDIDEESLVRYHARTDDLAKHILAHIVNTPTPHFSLCEGERCPFLQGDGLCSIILAEGQGTLPEICREHPRFRNFYGGNLVELSVGLSCEIAVTLLLKEENLDFLMSANDMDALTDLDSLSFVEFDEKFDTPNEYDILFLQKKYQIIRSFLRSNLSFDELAKNALDTLAIHNYCENSYRAQLALSTLETLNTDFSTLFQRASNTEELKKQGEKLLLADSEKKRLLVMTFFRHANTESFYSMESAFAFSLFFVSLVDVLILEMNIDKVEAIRILSSEIEYSQENTDILLDIFDV